MQVSLCHKHGIIQQLFHSGDRLVIQFVAPDLVSW